MAGPEILSITRTTGVAGQVAYAATVQYPGEPRQAVTFVGSVYGTPGPVVFIMDGMQAFVIDASRFGEAFDTSWVRRFYGAA